VTSTTYILEYYICDDTHRADIYPARQSGHSSTDRAESTESTFRHTLLMSSKAAQQTTRHRAEHSTKQHTQREQPQQHHTDRADSTEVRNGEEHRTCDTVKMGLKKELQNFGTALGAVTPHNLKIESSYNIYNKYY
jgi:hypothetical protein